MDMPTMKPKFTIVFENAHVEEMFKRRCKELGISGSAYVNALIKNDYAKGGPLTVTYGILDGTQECDGGCQSRDACGARERA